MRYAIVLEKSEMNFSAYVPDLPGCVATGSSLAETEMAIREALEMHIAGLLADGLELPEPKSVVHYLDVAA